MKKIILSTLVLFILIGSSCKKDLDIESTRVVAEKNSWNSLEDARGHLFGAYGLTRAALADHNAHWLYGDVRGGDFRSPNRLDLKAIINHNLTASYESLDALSSWRRWYAVINHCNIFLERVQEIQDVDPRYIDVIKNVDKAQIRFLRAFAYFYIARIWGDVPLITSSGDGKFEDKPKDPHNKVLQFVKLELSRAAEDLPFVYSTLDDPYQSGRYYNEGIGELKGVLATKNSAYAILAHAAAWEGNYADVVTATQFVLDNYSRSRAGYTSISNLTNSNGLFFKAAAAANGVDGGASYNVLLGFHFGMSQLEASTTGHLEELTLAAPFMNNKSVPDIYVTKDSIRSIFSEKNDLRFSLDTVSRPVNDRVYFTNYGGRYPIFTKVKVIENGQASSTFPIFSSSIVFTRLEDIVLLRAEALAVLGETGTAISLLNEIRTRRYDDDFEMRYDEAVHGKLIDAIFAERRKELMGEGHRWYDVVRYNRIKKENNPVYQLITSGGIYWPISNDILRESPLITQNSYWK